MDLPVFIQNHDPPAGTRINADVIVRLPEEVASIRYVKEETMPPGPMMSLVLRIPARRTLDTFEREELDEFLKGLGDLLTWRPRSSPRKTARAR
ncbi:MAG: hypothetical protein HY678_09265 [Chloroflexi bacterium]|nr:hypothetical protein [Chloroflexota bacterium]